MEPTAVEQGDTKVENGNKQVSRAKLEECGMEGTDVRVGCSEEVGSTEKGRVFLLART
jgi:hypothetical protein